MATTVAKLIAVIGADDRELDTGLARANAKMERAGQRMQSVGQALSVGMTAPLVAAGASLVKTAMGYEQAFNVMQATSGATAAEMEKVAAKAQELGADLTLPGTSAKDAMQAMLEMNKAGMTLTDTMASAKGVLQLSAAAQIENAKAAEIVANALNAFKLKGDQAIRVSDLLAAAAKSSSGTITDMAEAMQMSASIYSAAGQSVEDLTTSIAMMANAGIKGSDAGTSLKQMMLSLMAPTDKAAETMRQLGIHLFDARGKMLPLREIVGQFAGALSGMSQEQQNAALKTIFGTDAMRAALIVMGQGQGAFDAMKGKVTEHGVAAELAAAQNKGLAGALDALKSSWETLANSKPVEAFIRMLAGLVRLTAEALNLFMALPAPLQYAAMGIAAVAAAAGPLIFLLGTLVRMGPTLLEIFGALKGGAGAAGAIRAALGLATKGGATVAGGQAAGGLAVGGVAKVAGAAAGGAGILAGLKGMLGFGGKAGGWVGRFLGAEAINAAGQWGLRHLGEFGWQGDLRNVLSTGLRWGASGGGMTRNPLGAVGGFALGSVIGAWENISRARGNAAQAAAARQRQAEARMALAGAQAPRPPSAAQASPTWTAPAPALPSTTAPVAAAVMPQVREQRGNGVSLTFTFNGVQNVEQLKRLVLDVLDREAGKAFPAPVYGHG